MEVLILSPNYPMDLQRFVNQSFKGVSLRCDALQAKGWEPTPDIIIVDLYKSGDVAMLAAAGFVENCQRLAVPVLLVVRDFEFLPDIFEHLAGIPRQDMMVWPVEAAAFKERVSDLVRPAAPVGGEKEHSFFCWTCDERARGNYINPEGLAYFGRNPHERAGHSWLQVLHPHDRKLWAEKFFQAFYARTSYHVRARFRRADGQFHWFETVAGPIYHPDGLFRGFMGVSTDITNSLAGGQTAADEERFESDDEEYASEAIAHLCRRLEETNRLKDEFLATLSHELRTPLTVIKGHTDLMREGILVGMERVESLNIIARHATALQRLLDDLLDASRIVTGKMVLTSRETDLAQIIRDVLTTQAFALRAKNLTVHSNLKTDTRLPLKGDMERLRQVIWNLVSNAIKFTPAHGRIHITCGGENSEIVVRVRDNGIGIEKEFLPYVFDRFRQADSTTTRRFGGLGIGLAIVKHIVAMHGGTVTVTSAGLNRGTEFVLRLPKLQAMRITEVA